MIPFYSVIIPVFNRATELRAALASVLAQTDQDFEIIVVDDGSIDTPEHTVHAIGDARITLLRQDNRGGAAARNTGIDAARGRFVAFLDSDDTFLTGHLAAMRRLLSETKNVAGYARIIVDRGAGRTFLKPPRAIGSSEDMATYVLCDRGFVPTTTLVVETAWAKRVRYDERLAFAQDTDFCIRLYLAGCKFVMAAEPGAIWRDTVDDRRVSSGRKGAGMIDWLERIRPGIPQRAYYGARGWMIAKGIAPSSPFRALALYVSAAMRGCYRPRMAAVIALQIFFPDWLYRRLVDSVVEQFRGAVWSRADRAVRQQVLH